MGMGTESSAGAEGGNMGLPLLGALFGGGGGAQGIPGGTGRFSVGAGQAGPATGAPYLSGGPNDPYGTNLSNESSLMDKIKMLARDPETLKALGNTIKNLSGAINSANQIPGHVAPMLMNELNRANNPQYAVGERSLDQPYLGDIPQFAPHEAASILTSMGLA